MRRSENMCRLCSGTNLTFSVFSSQLTYGEQIRHSIFLATGVEIKETDTVSKSVCQRCCEIALKLHKYRVNAVENDKVLKERQGQLRNPPNNDSEEILQLLSKSSCEEEEIREESTASNDVDRVNNNTEPMDNMHTDVVQNKAPKLKYKHPSIRKLQKQFEHIIFPEEAFGSHVSPVITLDKSEVTDWFEEQANILQERLTEVVIKKVASSSTDNLTLPPIIPSDKTEALTSDKEVLYSNYREPTNEFSIKLVEVTNNQQTDLYKTTMNKNDLSIVLTDSNKARKEITQYKKNEADIPRKKQKLFYHMPSLELSSANEISKLDNPLPDSLFTTTAKTQPVFLCVYCSKLFDLKKDLLKHERVHLQCKFCRKRFKNIVSLNEHEQQSCFTVIIKNQPDIHLPRIDSIPSVVNKYLKPPEKNTSENPLPCTDNQTTKLERECNKTTNTNQVVYVSDDSDNEIQYTVISRHKIVENPHFEALQKSPDAAVQPNLSVKHLVQNNLNEKEVIHLLLKKHNYLPAKKNITTQTSFISNSNIRYTNGNYIILENTFSELFSYKIPVYLECQPKIVATFSKTLPQATTPILEYWAHKICTDIVQPQPVNEFINRSGYHSLPPTPYNKNTSYLNSTTPAKSSSIVNNCPTVTNYSYNTSKSLSSPTYQTMPNVPLNSDALIPPQNVVSSTVLPNDLNFSHVQNKGPPNWSVQNTTQWNRHHSNHLPRPIIQTNNIACLNTFVLMGNQSNNSKRNILEEMLQDAPVTPLHSPIQNQQIGSMHQYFNMSTPSTTPAFSNAIQPPTSTVSSSSYSGGLLRVKQPWELCNQTI